MTEELGGFEGAPEPVRRMVYLAVGVSLAAIAVAGVIVFQQTRSHDDDSMSKARELSSRLEAAGLAAPDPTTIADTLGKDGGLVCQDPSSPLIKARYRASISNGASGPGARPVIADDDVLKATALAITTYCPDELASYLKSVGDLKTGDTVEPDNHN
ncbi:hypothetical protein [Nocardia sp. NPDC005825]|uniref:hypothetical protein n=1 Tax=unclassified Nocardia TaxID=2637762 RepID=UPI0033E5439F